MSGTCRLQAMCIVLEGHTSSKGCVRRPRAWRIVCKLYALSGGRHVRSVRAVRVVQGPSVRYDWQGRWDGLTCCPGCSGTREGGVTHSARELNAASALSGVLCNVCHCVSYVFSGLSLRTVSSYPPTQSTLGRIVGVGGRE